MLRIATMAGTENNNRANRIDSFSEKKYEKIL